MVTSILNECLLLKSDPPESLFNYFKEKGITIFDEIIQRGGETKAQESKQTILYILCAYSEDSPLLILRQDTKEEKEQICEYLHIPEYLRSNLMKLGDREIRRATTSYISQFAGPLFKSLAFLKIQQSDFELSITNREYMIKKTEKGENNSEIITEVFDSKEHGKAINEHAKLAKQIDLLEKQIRAQIKRHEGIDDLKGFIDKQKDSGKIKGVRTGNVENAIGK